MRSIWIAFILLLLPSMAAAELKPLDFAYGSPLSLEKGGAVYRLSVPRKVYASVTRGDLSDIRVFNGRNVVAPHVLRLPEQAEAAREHAVILPFFPFYEGEDLAGKEGLSMQVEKSDRGTRIHVTEEAGARSDSRLSGYIVDAGRNKARIDEFDITWEGTGRNKIVPISVESSRDLSRWKSIVPKAILAHMAYQGHEISRNRIPLPATRAPYYKISWPADREGITVTGIRGIRRGNKPETARQWTEIKSVPLKGEAKPGITSYAYESPAMLPADRIRIRFVERNTLVKASLFSRENPEATWRRRAGGVFYHLRFDQTSLTQNTVSMARTSDRYWRVDIEEGASGGSAISPKVALGWMPYELLFVAQGEGPFMLAYGSARIGPEEQKQGANGVLAQIMGEERNELIRNATALPETLLGGEEMLVPAPLPTPWKTYLLWAVLVIGVGVIARMAYSLARGMHPK